MRIELRNSCHKRITNGPVWLEYVVYGGGNGK